MKNIIIKQSPNFNKGRILNGITYKPEIIVIHIMDGSLIGTDEWFGTKESNVSAHYGIGIKGEIHQYVSETDIAWHAGVVEKPDFKLYKGNSINPNLYTIGIEHEGRPLKNDVWSEEMKKSSSELISEISKRWNIPLDRDHIIGHYQIRASKPNCPALNKGIIDELILMAQKINKVDTVKEKIAEAISLHEKAITILKSI